MKALFSFGFLSVLGFALPGCGGGAGFSGPSGAAAKGASKQNAAPKPAKLEEPADTESAFHIVKIPAQKVLTDDAKMGLFTPVAETLRVPLASKGGKAPVTFTATLTGARAKDLVDGDAFVWTPGVRGADGAVDGEAGEHLATVTAHDADGKVATLTFTVKALPLALAADSQVNEAENVTTFDLFDPVHADRVYAMATRFQGQALEVDRCDSYAAGAAGIPSKLRMKSFTVTHAEKDGGGVTHFELHEPTGAEPTTFEPYVSSFVFSFEAAGAKPAAMGVNVCTSTSPALNADTGACIAKARALAGGANWFYCSSYLYGSGDRASLLKELLASLLAH